MKLETSFTALVIVGGWNQHILTPRWIRKHLLSAEDRKLTVEMLDPFSAGFNAQFVSPRISSKEIRILLQGNRLSLSPVEIEDKNFNRIQEIAFQLADCLPHTPVTEYGINFLFSENNINGDLIDLIRPRDLEKIKRVDTSLTGEEYTRRLVLNGYPLNFTIGLESKKATFKFNFHFKIGSLAALKGKISETPILKLKQEAVKFLAEIYDMELEGDIE